jgi:hypothetical protein
LAFWAKIVQIANPATGGNAPPLFSKSLDARSPIQRKAAMKPSVLEKWYLCRTPVPFYSVILFPFAVFARIFGKGFLAKAQRKAAKATLTND